MKSVYITDMAIDANAYWPIDLGMLAFKSVRLSCRTANDIYLSNIASGATYSRIASGDFIDLVLDGNALDVTEGGELVSGGGFVSAAEFALWTCDLADWTHDDVADDVDKDADGVTTLSQALTGVIGATYKLVHKITAVTVEGETPTLFGTAGVARTTAATFTEYIIATDATTGIVITPTNISRFTIDDISVKRITWPAQSPAIWVKGSSAGLYLSIIGIQ